MPPGASLNPAGQTHPPSRQDAVTHTRRAETTVDPYFAEIDATPLLSPAEERVLARRVRAGDAEARDHLVRANLRLVVHLARQFAGRGLPLEDLVAEGNMGLLRAAEGFDPDLGTRFTTYAAYWIKQSMRRAAYRSGNAVHLPQYMRALVGAWRQAAAALERELGREPAEAEVAARLGLGPRKVRALRKALRALAPAQVTDGDGGHDPVTTAADTREAGPGEALAEAEQLRAAVAALAALGEREAAVLRLRFGLDGSAPATLKELGARFGFTRERIRQIEQNALAQLRHRVVA